MGMKREYSEIDSEGARLDGSPSEQRHGTPDSENGQPETKRFKTTNKRKTRSREGTTNWNKTRARTIRRLLQSGKQLPATKRNDLEQELEALEGRVEENSFRKKRSNMIQKYHMVRFFERKKAERLLKQLRKKAEQTEDPEERKRFEAEAHVAEVDVAYARFFPLMERYESLYASKDKDAKEGEQEDQQEAEAKPFKQPKALQALHAERPKMWATVEKILPEGEAALYRLRDRKSPTDAVAQRQPRPERSTKQTGGAAGKTKAFSQQNDRKRDWKQDGKGRKWQPPVQAEDEDDGTGFFE
ncbi:hypothetical protein EsH8_IV_000882 [Colletotrichum jinshuiense]